MAAKEASAAAAAGVKATRVGLVVKVAMDQTVTVKVDRLVRHQQYGKIVRRSKKYLVHDRHGNAGVGDVVRIVECRPISKRKRWRLLEVVSKAE